MSQKGVLIVVSGFAGAGKGSIVKKLVAEYENYSLSVSMTTRNPRPGEVDGREYFFVTKEQFEQAISDDKLVEYANYVGNYYGTPKEYVDSQLNMGKDVILEIETNGALQIKKKFPESVLVFVTPPSATVLHERLIGRGTETPEVVAKRMAKASEESMLMEKYDFILVNDDLNACTEELHNIVRAMHRSPGCDTEFLEKIKKELEVFARP